jgi:long-chain fatty acid transport protein
MLGEVIANAIVRGRKDQEIKRLRERLEAENSYLREEAKTQFDYDEIVGDSDAIKHALVEADGNDWVFGYNFGAMLELGPGTRVGATYASEMEPDFSGDLEIDPQDGPALPTNSNVQFTFPQLVRVGVYHELNNRWALLGSAGREDWSEFDELLISTSAGTAAVPTEWRDTYHFGAGVHYRPAHDWLLQAGITYDTSRVSDANRTADLPIDRQIRYTIGAQHQWSERMTVGGAFEYIDLGEARINNPAVLQGEYETNRVFVIAVNLGYKF